MRKRVRRERPNILFCSVLFVLFQSGFHGLFAWTAAQQLKKKKTNWKLQPCDIPCIVYYNLYPHWLLDFPSLFCAHVTSLAQWKLHCALESVSTLVAFVFSTALCCSRVTSLAVCRLYTVEPCAMMHGKCPLNLSQKIKCFPHISVPIFKYHGFLSLSTQQHLVFEHQVCKISCSLTAVSSAYGSSFM